MKRVFLLSFLMFSYQFVFSQVGINNTSPRAQLDIVSSNTTTPSNSDGILIPRFNAFPTVNPTAAQHGMLVFLSVNVGTTQPSGFYYWDNTIPSWIGLNLKTSWELRGNAGTTPGTHFIGTTDAADLDVVTNNTVKLKVTQKGQLEIYNTGDSVFIGEGAGENDDLNYRANVFIGYNSGFSNTTGNSNIGVGYNALNSNINGYSNVAFGSSTLLNNTTGSGNAAFGAQALMNNITGSYNLGLGIDALAANISGSQNFALGNNTLPNNTTGDSNIGIGFQTIYDNVSGSHNIAVGYEVMARNSSSSHNLAMGFQALYNNNNGDNNVAIGRRSLIDLTSGSNNISFGYNAIDNLTTGSNNIAIGQNSASTLTSGSNNIYIGNNTNPVTAVSSNKLNIGNTIYGDLSATSSSIGIGVPNPTEKLEVNGKIKAVDINFSGIPVYPDNAAATSDPGLDSGDVYRVNRNLRIKL